MIDAASTTVATLGRCAIPSPLNRSTVHGDGIGSFVPPAAKVRYGCQIDSGADLPGDIFFTKAGPRQHLYFDPARTRAAIVTCGGICPGLNNVIRSAFFEFHHNYGIAEVLGIRFGYAGLNPASGHEPLPLTRDLVADIHEVGGTILGSSRGPQDPAVMVEFLRARRIDILICVGGDGTLRGARDLAAEAARQRLPLAVVGIPKTIDNDVLYVTRTFGVTTATEKARAVLDCAHNEATSAYNGVGLVKVMGRHAGFIAAAATLASQDVNFTLIPEVPFALAGDNGFLAHLRRRLEDRHHAVVVVAEGAGQDLMPAGAGGADASGNRRLADIGVYLKEGIAAFGKAAGLPVDVKYFDPSYFIRSVAANCEDSLLCDQLARHAVHAAMAGQTNAMIGFWNGTFTVIPIPLAVAGKRSVEPEGALWTSVLATTGQPRVMR